MPATTIKLEHDLVRKVSGLKPKDESISGFVRLLIEREHREREQRAAASAYQRFLAAHSEEKAAMEQWAAAPLSEQIKPARK